MKRGPVSISKWSGIAALSALLVIYFLSVPIVYRLTLQRHADSMRVPHWVSLYGSGYTWVKDNTPLSDVLEDYLVWWW